MSWFIILVFCVFTTRATRWQHQFVSIHFNSYKLLPCRLHKPVKGYYSCSLSTATIQYSCPSVCLSLCVCVCLCVSVCVHDNSKNNGSIHLKLEQIVVYENISDEFDIGHCPIKVKIRA